jgi:hypothetical protein
MNPQEIETAYTAIANAIHQVGESHAQLFLATLCLSLVADRANSEGVETLIAQAARLAQT